MYPIDARSFDGLRAGRHRGIGRNVYFLGLTSLFTDISAEMVASVLPVYIVVALQLTPLQYGFIDGIYQGAAALAALIGGWFADRGRAHRAVAGTGYALSAACKLGLLAAGASAPLVSAAVAADRIGKGLRTAPRDALISLSSSAERLGLAFGVHRAFDTAGALLGPLVAFAILSALPGAYDVVFVSSFFIAVIGVATIALLVQSARRDAAAPARGLPTLAQAAGLLTFKPFRGIVLAACVLGLVTVGDSFFYLLLQEKTGITPGSFPLLFAATALTYLLLAVPAGRAGDRIGRIRVYLIGYGVLLVAYAVLLSMDGHRYAGFVALALLGAFYACTDGVLMAAASAQLPPALRSSGLAIVATAGGLARMAGSFLFGAAWTAWGIERSFLVFGGALLLALPFAVRLLARPRMPA